MKKKRKPKVEPCGTTTLTGIDFDNLLIRSKPIHRRGRTPMGFLEGDVRIKKSLENLKAAFANHPEEHKII